MNPTLFHLQDTLVRKSPDPVSVRTHQNDSVSSVKKFSAGEAEAIFRSLEKRERQRDSIVRVQARRDRQGSVEQQRVHAVDTFAVPYNLNGSPPALNPLDILNKQFFSAREVTVPVFHEQAKPGALGGNSVIAQRFPFPLPASQELRPDWLLFVILGSLVLLAWLKLFYNKFLDQTVQSIGNFQLSSKFLRDQNIFSRRVAFALNLNFVFIGAAYIYLVSGFFNIRFFPLNTVLSFLSFAGIISVLLILRYLVSRILGHVFQMQSPFREYLHQLLLIYKNLGIALLVIVVGIAYLRQDLRIYLVLLSASLLLAAIVLRIIRGLKIVLVHRGVLIFYLILYLCTLEILPILIFYRFFAASVLEVQV